jgi:hypothetical protein
MQNVLESSLKTNPFMCPNASNVIRREGGRKPLYSENKHSWQVNNLGTQQRSDSKYSVAAGTRWMLNLDQGQNNLAPVTGHDE